MTIGFLTCPRCIWETARPISTSPHGPRRLSRCVRTCRPSEGIRWLFALLCRVEREMPGECDG
jgi:hypothetical protein